MVSRLALRALTASPRPFSGGSGSVAFSIPLGRTLGRPLTHLSVATSARSSAIACRKAAFSASSCSAKGSSLPRGRPERLIFFGLDMPGTGRVQAGPAQPRQLTSAWAFAPRTIFEPQPELVREQSDRFGEGEQLHVDLLGRAVSVVRTPDELLAVNKGKPGNPAQI